MCYYISHGYGGKMERNENLEICKNCGGMCCKKSGCDLWIEDIEDKTQKGILELLATEKYSIVALMNFKRINGKICNMPFLYLRARNQNRDIVDLLSMKTTCINLRDNGCEFSYENRPSGGKNLTPSESGNCVPKENPFEKIKLWAPYQNLLTKIVKRYTGKSVDKVVREDAIRLIKDIACNNINGVSPLELADIKGMLPMLAQCYPEEVQIALQSIKNTPLKF